MGKSPCQSCECRKLTCHDRCEAYNNWHDALVEARRDLYKAQMAIDYIYDAMYKTVKRRSLPKK